MQTEAEQSREPHADVPSHFVVEIRPGLFVICARTMVLEPGEKDFSRALIEDHLKNAPLRAAALPGWSGGGDPCGPQAFGMAYRPQTGAYSAQTGKVVININC